MLDHAAPKIDDAPFIVDADSHWSEPPDLFTSRAPAEYQRPRAAGRGGRRRAQRGCSTATSSAGTAPAGGDRPRRQEGAAPTRRSFEWDHDEVHVGAYDPKVRLEVLDECGIDAQIIFPSTIGLGGQDLGMVEDEALVPRGGRDLQRRHGRDPGRLGQPAAAAAADAGVGRRRVRRRGQAGRRARRPRREHDVRPAGPRRARPRQPGVGPVLGDVHRAAAARCTSTSAPASPA